MKFLGRIGIGLSVIFTCLLLALVGEIYYLLWWKRRITRRNIEDGYSTKEQSYIMFCCKTKSPIISSSSVNPTNTPQTHQSQNYPDFQFDAHTKNKDYSVVQPTGNDENGIETQLITGPPRFLFPIKEETREDLESEDGKSREGKRSLSDLLKKNDHNNSSPMRSSSNQAAGLYYNPFNEASSEAEFNKMMMMIKCSSSPPPKFKFLRDAEDKLQKKILLMEEINSKSKKTSIILSNNENDDDEVNHQEDGCSFTTIVVSNYKENDELKHLDCHLSPCIIK